MVLYDRTIGNALAAINSSFMVYYFVWIVVTPFVDSSHFTQILFPPREYGLAIPAFIVSVVLVVAYSASSYHIICETGQREKIVAMRAAYRQQAAAAASNNTNSASAEDGDGGVHLGGAGQAAMQRPRVIRPSVKPKKGGGGSQSRSNGGGDMLSSGSATPTRPDPTDGGGVWENSLIRGTSKLSSKLLHNPKGATASLRSSGVYDLGDDDDIVVDRSQLLGSQFNMSAVRTGGLYGGRVGVDKSAASSLHSTGTGPAAAAMNNRARGGGDFSPEGDSSGMEESVSPRNSQPSTSMPPSGGAAAAAGGFHSRGNSFS